jgi:predicted SnoaL-like aldol condensation-catalyzing enzyme
MMLTALAALAAAFEQPAPSTCRASDVTHRQIVADFYREALIEKRPRAAFERFMAPDFIEHKPDVPGGTRDGAAQFLDGLIKSMPDPKWEVLRIVADGELVALHARFTPAPGAAAYAIADFFRLKDCKIVAHWDVVAGPPKEQVNPKPRF